MLTVILGLGGAMLFGSADFLGGLASKAISPLRVTALAATFGLVVLLVALPFTEGTWSGPAVLWGALSGIAGAAAISLLYACLAVGPMSILSPVTAVVSAAIPMVWGIVGGDRFGAYGYAALGLALIAIVLVGFVPERGAVRPRPIGLAMAFGSGAMIGVFMILIDAAPHDSGLVPLVMNRAVNAAIMFSVVAVLALRTRGRSGGNGWRAGIAIAIAGGLVDATANVLLLFGLRSGNLSVMSVLTAMYPAGTILLAAVVLRERIAPVQWVGLALALGAAAMLALA